MERKIINELLLWKQQKSPLPLLVRGARQVGKSYIIERFGHDHFDNTIVLNFEYHPEYSQFFESLVPEEILKKIYLTLSEKVTLGKTLLFLDEIQECPNAIMALRYFKEKMPGLHVIGAGSLLEFAINDEAISMPVGRIEFLRMRPVSFQEFLRIIGRKELVEFLSQVTLSDGIPISVHETLLKCVREYMVVGGMPAVIQQYLEDKTLESPQRMQSVILNTYRSDFGKYGKKTNHKHLQTVFQKTPALIGQGIHYSKIDPDVRSRELKKSIELLKLAGIIYPAYACSASGLPLNALINEKKFKLIYLDVGLVKRLTGLGPEILMAEELLLINRGAIAEQFVGQELLANADPYDDNELFYWERGGRGVAEVDYVVSIGSRIVPIEVKAGATGTLKSLRIMMQEKKLSTGVRISQHQLGLDRDILSVPLYMISELERLIRSL